MRDSMSRKKMAEARTKVRLFPEFRRALLGKDIAMETIPETTLQRYLKGELPQVFVWFVEYPDLLMALYRDAVEMTDEQKTAFLRSFEYRSKERKDAREKRARRRGDTVRRQLKAK